MGSSIFVFLFLPCLRSPLILFPLVRSTMCLVLWTKTVLHIKLFTLNSIPGFKCALWREATISTVLYLRIYAGNEDDRYYLGFSVYHILYTRMYIYIYLERVIENNPEINNPSTDDGHLERQQRLPVEYIRHRRACMVTLSFFLRTFIFVYFFTFRQVKYWLKITLFSIKMYLLQVGRFF